MAHLIIPLRVTAVSANKKSNEHFISLRDYDFVGEDPRLKLVLVERMKVLQGEGHLSDLEKPPRGRRAPAPSDMHRPPPAYKPKPDYLNSSFSFPQMVNVSLDYAELYNASELFPEMNASWHPPASAPAHPGLRGLTNPFPGPGGRRQDHNHPGHLVYNKKTLELMKQMIYGTQLRILELDPLIKKHEPDPRFRMAYIFNRLDEWLRNLRTLHKALSKRARRVKRIIWYYENSLRINIDITYSIEHLVFLHNEYMKIMEALVPMSKRKAIKEKKKHKKGKKGKKKGKKES